MEPRPAPLPDNAPAVLSYSDPEWRTAKRGLVTYRLALIISVIVGIGGGVLGGILGAGSVLHGGLDGLVAVLWFGLILAVVGLALSAWKLLGLYRYAKVPAETGGRGPATAALVISVLGLLVGIYSTVELARDLLGDVPALAALAAKSKDAWLSNAALLGELVGFICLVVSLSKVAAHVGAGHVVRMIGSFILMVCFLIGLFVLMLLVPHPAIALLGGLGMLVLLIISLVKFLRILEALGAAIGGLDVSKVFE